MSDNEIRDKLLRMKIDIDAILCSIDKDTSDQNTIRDIVIDYFHVSREGFESTQRTFETRVLPRDFYFFFGRSLLGISFPRLSQNTGNQNHATAIHGVNNIINWLDAKDKEVVKHYEYLSSVFDSAGYDINLVKKYIREHKEKERSSLKRLRSHA